MSVSQPFIKGRGCILLKPWKHVGINVHLRVYRRPIRLSEHLAGVLPGIASGKALLDLSVPDRV